MADVEKVDLERSDLHRFASLDVDQFGFHAHTAPVELVLNQAVCEGRGVNWCVHIFKQVTNRAGVVLMPVGDDNAPNLVCPLLHIFKIRDDVINADHVVVGEHHAGIHNQ